MSRQFFARYVTGVLTLALCAACSKHTTTAPSSTPPPSAANAHAKLDVTAVTVTGETHASGYSYRTVVHLKETAGVAATISSIDLKFLSGGATVASLHHSQPISDTSNVCPASSAVDTRELLAVDEDPSHAYATSVHVTVTFTDSTSVVATAEGNADVDALSAPPAPVTYTLSGVIGDESTRRGIDGARVEVVNGTNAGRATTTDNTGRYVLDDLASGSFRLRASATSYDAGEQGVAVPANPQADFLLRKSTGCFYTLSSVSQTVLGAGSTGALSAAPSAPSGCTWTASTDDSWITLNGARSGTGAATVSYSVAPNTGTGTRYGSITIQWAAGRASFYVYQYPSRASCRPTMTVPLPPNAWQNYLLLDDGCYPPAVSAIDVPWIQILGTHGGGKFLLVSVQANSGAARTGHITFSDEGKVYLQITFTQDTGHCVTAISPTSQAFDENGGTGQITVTAGATCTWTARAVTFSVTFTGSAQGTGNGVVSFSVAANIDVTGRSGALNIGGLQFGITQKACQTSVSPTELTAPAAGGTFTVTVSGSPTCRWVATSVYSFITVSRRDELRTGPGTVTVTVSPNTTGQPRTGSVGIADRSIRVTQS